MRAGEGTLRVGEKQLDQLRSLIPPHPLTNFKTKDLLLWCLCDKYWWV